MNINTFLVSCAVFPGVTVGAVGEGAPRSQGAEATSHARTTGHVLTLWGPPVLHLQNPIHKHELRCLLESVRL